MLLELLRGMRMELGRKCCGIHIHFLLLIHVAGRLVSVNEHPNPDVCKRSTSLAGEVGSLPACGWLCLYSPRQAVDLQGQQPKNGVLDPRSS